MTIFLFLLLIVSAVLAVIYYQKYKKTLNEFDDLNEKDRMLEETNYLELENLIKKREQSLKYIEKDIEREQVKLSKANKESEIVNNLINDKRMKVKQLKNEIDVLNEDISMQEFGIYKPRYNFASSMGYKETLKDIRDRQKQMIRNKTAVSFNTEWKVNGSKAEGTKMTNNNIRQILRSFNNECEVLINKVTYKNFDRVEIRIIKVLNDLNKLNRSQQVAITDAYLALKLEEMYLAFEYAEKKEDEREELRRQKEQEREEKAFLKEIEEKKKIVDKEISHYNNRIEYLYNKIQNNESIEQIESIKQEISDIKGRIAEKEMEKEDLDYRQAHSSAGYVYVISNIGAFGENVLKIGVTRRLDPLERIRELSSASVPFTYDVHALIFSYEAYGLESELHNYFDKYRVNKVNTRKEFFKVPIGIIENKLKEYGGLTIDFNSSAEAEEYRETLAIEKQIVN